MRAYVWVLIAVLMFGFTQGVNGKEYKPSSLLERKIGKQDKRYQTFECALQLLQERDAQVVVETGTSRCGDRNCTGDGCSTLIFGEWARKNSGIFYSVDINKKALVQAAKALGKERPYVQLVHSDSVAFLRDFQHPIDFLYLDSYDFEERNPVPSQEHHLKEIAAAYPWLTKNSVVMIDDCGLPHGGKGKLAIAFLVERGWRMVANAYQVILVQD